MGHQIVKQPEGRLAIFSDGVDGGCWLRWDMNAAQCAEWFADRAARSARESAARQVGLVLADSPLAYGRDAHTFAELNAYSQANGHEVLNGPVDAVLLAELQRPLDDADDG
jgi:hypothetical protein